MGRKVALVMQLFEGRNFFQKAPGPQGGVEPRWSISLTEDDVNYLLNLLLVD